MKKLLPLFIVEVLTLSVLAQAPEKMSYQAVIRNVNGALVVNQAVGMRISILKGSATGTAVYVETQTPTTNENGLATIEIGGGTLISGTFAGINWSTGPYFMKTETDPAGGTSYTIVGTTLLLSVPYALHAKKVENGFSGNFNDLTNRPSTTYGYGITDAVTTAGDQTIGGYKTFTGTIDGGNKAIINVAGPKNAQDVATKEYVDALKTSIDSLFKEINNLKGIILSTGSVLDYEGNSYQIVIIGTQVWMAENLKVTKLNDGTDIQLVTDNIIWTNTKTPGYCWYNNDINNKGTYGALYNWYCVGTGKLCPIGWHVPSDSEWAKLITYLGEDVAGSKLKESGLTHWNSPNESTNETYFTALPGGYRGSNGVFYDIGIWGSWYTSTEDGLSSCWTYGIINSNTSIFRSNGYKWGGDSVRCIKD